MLRRYFFFLAVSMVIGLCQNIALSPPSLALGWEIRKPRGTIKVVDLYLPAVSAMLMYSDFLISKDKDNNFVPSLAKDWRWVNDRTIEFKLREGVWFHNGEKFNAEAVKVNWEEYKRMEHPTIFRFMDIPDDTVFEVLGKYRVAWRTRVAEDTEGMFFYLAGRRQPGKNTSLRQSN